MEEFECLTHSDEGVYKKILEHGHGPTPSNNQEVVVNYKGGFENEVIFDQNSNFHFILGSGEVIRGWEIAIPTMKKGEIAILVVRYDYGYGKEGFSIIQPYSTLLYQVELVDFFDKK